MKFQICSKGFCGLIFGGARIIGGKTITTRELIFGRAIFAWEGLSEQKHNGVGYFSGREVIFSGDGCGFYSQFYGSLFLAMPTVFLLFFHKQVALETGYCVCQSEP